MKWMIRGSVLLIVAAIVALLVRKALLTASTPEQPAAPAQVTVRVAATPLPAGRLLRDAELGWLDMPASQVPKNAITRGDGDRLARLQGALLRRPVEAGTPIRLEDVMTADSPGFLAAALKPGMRAISVPITSVSSNSGLIQPGDFIDVILTQQVREAEPGRRVASETIATGIRVIAVGSTFIRPADPDKVQVNDRARTVTLEVAPRTAEIITVAQQMGELSLILRSFANEGGNQPGEQETPRQVPTWSGDISRTVSTPTSDSGDILVLRGSRKTDTRLQADSPAAPVPQ